jgi:hypothetical protein
MVFEFRYKGDDDYYGSDIKLYKVHPDLIIKLSKEDIWNNDHISLIDNEIFKISQIGKLCGLGLNEIMGIGIGQPLEEERIKSIKDIEIDTCIVWGPASDSPIAWNFRHWNDLKSLWIDLESYQRYRQIVLGAKFDPQNNRDHLIIDEFDKIMIPLERDILINKITN